MTTLLILSIILSFLTLPPMTAKAEEPRPLSDQEEFRRELDTWLSTHLSTLNVAPSVAVAVVVGNQTVVADGWGVIDLESGTPATGETVYYIASATKPFTGLMAAVLDARGQLSLDSKFTSYLGSSHLADSIDVSRVRLRDLLTHSAGFQNSMITGRLAFTGEHDEETLWNLLAHSSSDPESPYGTYRYDNLGYNVYTMVQDRVTGRSWQDVLEETVLAPLGMKHTSAYASKSRLWGVPIAAPHFGLHPDGPKQTYLQKEDDTMQSAGGLLTTAADMGRWLECQLNDGQVGADQVVPADAVRAAHAGLVHVENERPPFGSSAYGLGWNHGSYQERAVLHHSGGFSGFSTTVSFMPEARIGVAVLVNDSTLGNYLTGMISTWVYDWWLQTESPDSVVSFEDLTEMRDRFRKKIAEDLESRSKRRWMLSRDYETYAGTYISDLWGTVVVEHREGDLHVRSGNLHCIATAMENPETARLELVPGRGIVIRFEPPTGPVERVIVDGDVYEREG